MQDLRDEIEADDEEAQEEKKEEWLETSTEYEQHIAQASKMTCLYERDMDDVLVHDAKSCTECYLERVARRMRIQVHERYLSDDDTLAKATVFELAIPEAFAAWRDATWVILRDMMRPQQVFSDKPPHLTIHEYPPFADYVEHVPKVLLASKTKSFMKTHYASTSLPVTLEKLILPSGLKYALLDTSGYFTARQIHTPSLSELVKPKLSSKSPFSSLTASLHPKSGVTGITSNEVIAWQTSVPRGMSVLEGWSFQELRIGHNLQWPRLPRELTSPVLNFANEAVSLLVRQLALQAGPKDCAGSLRRVAHWPFEDRELCNAMLTALARRVTAVSSNYRECDSVETYLTLILRLITLTTI